MNGVTINYNPVLSAFSIELSLESGQNVNACFQCRKCASGCPVAFAMDMTPTQIIHAARLGLGEEVLNSRTIWLCASCQTCTTRCPQDVDIAKVMDAARIIAMRRGVKPRVPSVKTFFKSAVSNIKNFGRMYELGLILALKLKSGDFTKDMELGREMFKKGKIKLLPSFKGMRDSRRIHKAVKKMEKKEQR